jgi:hypothetical protein
MPAWIPLAVVIGAACTASRARVAGAALAALLAVSFVAASIRIGNNAQYQRPNWRGVASALGAPIAQRAIVVYDAQLATDPLELYLRGVPWGGGAGPGAVRVSEVAIVGSPFDTPPSQLPAGTSMLSRRVVDGYLVERVRLAQPQALTSAEIAARAGTLLGPAPPAPAVLVQHPD